MQSKKSTLSGAFFGGDSGNRTPQCALRLLSAFCFVFYAKSFASQTFRLYAVRLPLKKLKHPFGCFFGGDGGNRTPQRALRLLSWFCFVFYAKSFASQTFRLYAVSITAKKNKAPCRVLFGGDGGNRTPQRTLRLLSAFCFVFYAEKLCFANFSIVCGFDYRLKN